MSSEVSPEQARRILDMLTEGGAMDDINTPLALRLTPLALELEDTDLAERLLLHAKTNATDDLERGWADFEKMKYEEQGIDSFAELGANSELIDGGTALAAAVSHHVALLHLSQEEYEEAQTFASRSLRLREKIEDLNGISYGLALLETCSKRLIKLVSSSVFNYSDNLRNLFPSYNRLS